jgi:hypothetical protein
MHLNGISVSTCVLVGDETNLQQRAQRNTCWLQKHETDVGTALKLPYGYQVGNSGVVYW